MNIWIFNQYADGPDGQATRDYDRAKVLVGRGHSVTIFSAGFSQYTLRDDRLQPGERYKIESYGGVRFVWIKVPPYQRSDRRRAVNMAAFAWRAYWTARKIRGERPDVVIGTSVHPLAPASAYFVARRQKARFFFSVTDLWPQVLIDMGAIGERSIRARLMRRLEHFSSKRAEKILCVLPGAADYFSKIGFPRSKVVCIPNGVNFEYFRTMKPFDGGADFPLCFMYLGGHTPHHELDSILEAARSLEAEGEVRFRIVFVGSGVEKPRLIDKAKSLDLSTVEFRDPVPKQRLFETIGEADVLLCPQKPLSAHRFGLSLFKIPDYMASGRPIIYAVRDPNDPVRAAHAGVSIEPGDAVAMAGAIRAMIEMSPAQRTAMGQSGLLYARSVYDVNRHAEALEAALAGHQTG